MSAANKKGFIIVVIVGLVAMAAGFGLGWVLSSDQPQPPGKLPDGQRLIKGNYWRLANWEQLGPGTTTDPNPGNCGPNEFSDGQSSHAEAIFGCLERPVDPAQTDEEVVEMISAESLDRFNVDTKPRAMRIISSYSKPVVSFPYRPATPETCRSNTTNIVENTVRDGLDLSGSWAGYAWGDDPKEWGPKFVSSWGYVIAQNCGDWRLDYQTLAERYGGAFFYQEPLERFNVDDTAFGIRPVRAINYPSRFRYTPSTPESCRYYFADSSFRRQAVDDLFTQNQRPDGTRGGGFAQSVDTGGWYDYKSPVDIAFDHHGSFFMISEGCGDWFRDGVNNPPATNQIFDHPYYSYSFTY